MNSFTTEQARQFDEAVRRHLALDGIDVDLIRRGLDEAGITVQFPEPRYRAMKSPGRTWLVVDTHATDNPYDDPTTVASFHSTGSAADHPDPAAGAKAEADRLNGEVSP